MKTILNISVLACLLVAAPSPCLALGADHPKGTLPKASHWPEGLAELVNVPDRIHGYFVNATDVFFFRGNQESFARFLREYARMEGLTSRKIVIHPGLGRAKSPWQKDEGSKCDWKIQGIPAAEKLGDGNAKGYILEIHVWEAGGIKVDKDKLPAGMTIERPKG